MRIAKVEIHPEVSDKNEWKHSVQDEEIHEVFRNNPKVTFIEKGHVDGENLYRALGQTNGGRLLLVIFIYKMNHSALVMSARGMTSKERKRYGKK